LRQCGHSISKEVVAMACFERSNVSVRPGS
jgi:hypothetical protein